MIESPCNKVCIIDPATSLCRGCGRTGAEITAWAGMPPADRRRIMDELGTRMDEHGLVALDAPR